MASAAQVSTRCPVTGSRRMAFTGLVLTFHEWSSFLGRKQRSGGFGSVRFTLSSRGAARYERP